MPRSIKTFQGSDKKRTRLSNNDRDSQCLKRSKASNEEYSVAVYINLLCIVSYYHKMALSALYHTIGVQLKISQHILYRNLKICDTIQCAPKQNENLNYKKNRSTKGNQVEARFKSGSRCS